MNITDKIGNIHMIDVLTLAQECAPEIPARLIVAIAQQESSNNPYVIGHPSVREQPNSAEQGTSIANELAARGKRYDAGLMQISSENFSWLGLDNHNVMDPCTNVAAAQKVILVGLQVEGKNAVTVFNTISRYNAGNARIGYRNGYLAGITSKILKQTPATDHNMNTGSKQQGWADLGNMTGLFTQHAENLAQNDVHAENSFALQQRRPSPNERKAADSQIQQMENSRKRRSGAIFFAHPGQTRGVEMREQNH